MSVSTKNVVNEIFFGEATNKWNSISGAWFVQPDVDVYDVEVRDIYRSPKAPSHVSWVGLRMEPNNVLNKESLKVVKQYKNIMFWAILNPKISESFLQVNAIKSAKKRNVYVDTSSANSILSNLIE